MNILTRFRVGRMRRELAELLAVDPLLAWKTTEDLMSRMSERADKIAILRHEIRQLEGEVDIDPDDDGTGRVPSSLFCPTTKPE